MEYSNYLSIMRGIRKIIIEYIESEGNTEENYEKIIKYFNDHKIFENTYIFKEIITLLLCISNNHHRTESFFEKIDRILLFFKDEILKKFSNYEIFTIFRKNYRILLFMIQEQILKPDFSIFSSLTYKTYKKAYYPHYFSPEFKLFFENKEKVRQEMNKKMGGLPPNGDTSNKNSEIFEKKRKIAENDEHICKLIRKDSLDEFITYISKVTSTLSSKVGSSIFETNTFLINENPTLIEYAAFNGSLKIFNYLIENNIELTPSLWLYAIHGNNMELIHILENNKIVPEDETYQSCLLEAIKCHHDEMTEYILKNIIKDQYINKKALVTQSVRYNNYDYFPEEMIVNSDIFFDLCKYDFIYLVELFLKENLDLNQTKVFNSNFEIKFLKNIFF